LPSVQVPHLQRKTKVSFERSILCSLLEQKLLNSYEVYG
jgi:hypothetical protein